MAAARGVSLGEFLRAQGFTQNQCATAAGVPQSVVSELVANAVDPKFSTVIRVARWAKRVATARKLPVRARLDVRTLRYPDL